MGYRLHHSNQLTTQREAGEARPLAEQCPTENPGRIVTIQGSRERPRRGKGCPQETLFLLILLTRLNSDVRICLLVSYSAFFGVAS